MTDNELRGIILRKYYEKRREPFVDLQPGDFDPEIPEDEIARISIQLYEAGLIKYRYTRTAGNTLIQHSGDINADGIDVVEGTAEPPLSIDNRTYNITHSTGIQIGDHNTQHIELVLKSMIQEIDAADLPAKEKRESKGLLRRWLEHPAIVQVFGELLSRLPSLP